MYTGINHVDKYKAYCCVNNATKYGSYRRNVIVKIVAVTIRNDIDLLLDMLEIMKQHLNLITIKELIYR